MSQPPNSPPNRNIAAAWRYHNDTKHSWHSIHTDAHHLDWNNEPRHFKLSPSRLG